MASFEQLLDAAAAGGFGSVSMFPPDYRKARESGLGDADMRGLMEDRGVRVAVLDPYTKWLPDWSPPANASADAVALVGFDEEEFFSAAEALGCESISVVEAFGRRYELEQVTESFAAVCDRAAESGVRVQLEFIPFSGIRDLGTAWEVVRGADRPNGGLVFDFWHYLRGGPDDEVLAGVPGARVLEVQVCDALAEPAGPLVRDSLRHRRLPGEGEWDVDGLLATLLRKEGLGAVGVEVFSEELWKLAPVEIARRSGDALRRTLDAARRVR